MPPTITETFNNKYSGVLAHMLGIKKEEESRGRGGTQVLNELPVGTSVSSGEAGVSGDNVGEDQEEREEQELEVIARKPREGPPEITDSFFARKAYTYCSVGGNNVLAYLLEVKNPNEIRGIKSAVATEVAFAYADRYDGVKSSSYLSKYGGRTYVLGFFTGKIDDLQAEFHGAGFDRVNYDNGKAAFAVLATSRSQRAPNLPLRNLDDFDKTMKQYVTALTSK